MFAKMKSTNTLIFIGMLFVCFLFGIALSILDMRQGIVFCTAILSILFCVIFYKIDINYSRAREMFFILVVTYVLLVVVWPRYASIPLSFLPIRNPRRLAYIVTAGMAVMFFLFFRECRDSLAKKIKKQFIFYALMAGFVAFRLISILMANDVLFSATVFMTEFFGVYLLFLIWLVAIDNKCDVGKVITVICFAAVISSVVVIFEASISKNPYLLVLGIDPSESAYYAFLFNRVRDGYFRAQGAFEHPLLLLEFSAFCFPLLISKVFLSKKHAETIFWLICILVFFVAVYFTRSRSSYAFIAISSLFWVVLFFCRRVLNQKKAGYILLFIGFVIVVSTTVWLCYSSLESVAYGQTHMQRLSSQARVLMLVRGLPIVLDNVLLGVGPGYAALQLGIIGTEGMPICDNYYLQIAMESGMPALCLFVLSILYYFKKVIGAILFLKLPEEDMFLLIGLCSGVIGILSFKGFMAELQNFEFLIFGFVSSFIMLGRIDD